MLWCIKLQKHSWQPMARANRVVLHSYVSYVFPRLFLGVFPYFSGTYANIGKVGKCRANRPFLQEVWSNFLETPKKSSKLLIYKEFYLGNNVGIT